MRTLLLILLLLLSSQVSACMFPVPQGQRNERSGDGDNRHGDNRHEDNRREDDRHEDNGRDQGQRGGNSYRENESRHDGRN